MSTKFARLFASLIILHFSMGNAQDVKLPQIIPPSPDASSLGKFGDIPVGNYTGLPGISIPIHSVVIRDVNLPISLSYHASGIRVEEESSWVGLGWALSAGGMVSRTVRGGDDFGTANEPGYAVSPEFPPKEEIPGPYGPILMYPTTFIVQACLGSPDTQPDIFNYNFLGYSGKFFLKKRIGSAPFEVQLSSDGEKVSITYDDALLKWTILTKDGFKAVFGTKEYTNNLSGSVPDPLNPPNPLSWEPHPDVITSWYLDRLTSPTGEIIDFVYDIPAGQQKPTYTSRSIISISESRSRLQSVQGPIDVPGDFKTKFGQWLSSLVPSSNPLITQGNPCTNTGSSYSGSMTITWNVYLKTILFKNGRVEFINGTRDDIGNHFTSLETFAGPRRLNSIEIYQNTDKLKSVDFSYSYYNGNEPTSPYLHKRLKLDQVIETSAPNTKKPYVFGYIGDNPVAATFLPPKNSAARDHWGLYNGKVANNTLYNGRPGFIPQFSFASEDDGIIYTAPGADREADEESSKQGVLDKVTYPTGGHTKIFYESHTVSSQETVDLPQERPYFLTANPADNHINVFELNQVAGIAINAAIKCPTLSCYPGGSSTPCNFTAAMYSEPYITITSFDSGEIVYRKNYSDYQCKFYENTPCDSHVQQSYCGITRADDISLPMGRYLIRTHPQFGFEVDANVSYQLLLTANPQLNIAHFKGGGLRVSKIVDNDGISDANDIIKRFDYTTRLANGAIVSTGQLMTVPKYHTVEITNLESGSTIAQCVIVKSTSYSNVPLGSSAQGSPIGYDQVTVLNGENGENGYTVYTYKNDPDLEADPYVPNSPTTNHSASNGLLLKEAHYTRDRFKVKEIESQYSPTITGAALPAIFIYSTNGCNGSQNGSTMYREYSETSEWWYMTTKSDRTYDVTDITNTRFTEVSKTFTYGSNHKQIATEQTTTSNGTSITTTYSYPLDLQEAANAPMWQSTDLHYKHIHSTVLLQKTEESGSPAKFISSVKNNYAYQPDKDLVVQVSMDIGINSTTYETRVLFEKYDNNGNLRQVRKKGDAPTAYLWGYNLTLPVAQATNATWDQIYYEGFETYASATNNPLNAHSGSYHGEISFYLYFGPPPGTYELSYWSYAGGSWTNVKQPFTGPLTLTAERLDDIRIYPVGSQMTTYDYDPHIGIITSTDANNLSSHFTYDEFQRLMKITDPDRNLVKGFNYQYKN